jgi:LEA14-like dessication related protein
MRDNSTILLGAAGVLVAGYFVMKNRQPVFMPDMPIAPGTPMQNVRVKLGGITTANNDIIVNFMVQNPNSNPIELMSFVGDFMANGNKVGEVQMFGDYVIRDNTEMAIPVVLKIKDISIRQMIRDRKTGLNFSFKGIMNINRIPVPITLR